MADLKHEPVSVTQDAPASVEELLDEYTHECIEFGMGPFCDRIDMLATHRRVYELRTALLSVLTPSGGGIEQGASFGTGHPSSTQPAGGLCPSGGSPSRDRWRPIRTAPRNSQTVLLGWYAKVTDDPADWNWITIAGWYESGPADRCWYDITDERVEPTHWMPAPTPPAPGMEAEGRNPQGSGAEHDSPIAVGEALSPTPSPEAPQTGIQVEVPDGWVLVPREPTPKMLAAARTRGLGSSWAGICYRAMINDAPPPSRQEGGGRSEGNDANGGEAPGRDELARAAFFALHAEKLARYEYDDPFEEAAYDWLRPEHLIDIRTAAYSAADSVISSRLSASPPASQEL